MSTAAAVRSLVICSCLLASGSSASVRTIVFVVHGTYDGTADWVKIVSNRVTFASELRRGFGEEADVEIQSPLWKSSVQHAVRVTAAKSLANEIDLPEFDGAKIVLVAHSHGGNVALLAAGQCRRRVAAVVCLATPHVYWHGKNDQGQILELPVYCSPAARKNIDRIVTLTARTDPVAEMFASLRNGIDEQTAIDATRDWRKLKGDPRLVDDGSPLRELFEELLDVKLGGNLIVNPLLNVADRNLVVACERTGVAVHGLVHSCRVGFLLGGVLSKELSEKQLDNLESLVIPADADDGNSLASDVYQKWRSDNLDNMEFSGWTMSRAVVTTSKQSKPTKEGKLGFWDLDHSFPDVFLRATSLRGSYAESETVRDLERVDLRPLLHFSRLRKTHRLEIYDRDLSNHDLMGSIEHSNSNDSEPPARLHSSKQFDAELFWIRAHH